MHTGMGTGISVSKDLATSVLEVHFALCMWKSLLRGFKSFSMIRVMLIGSSGAL